MARQKRTSFRKNAKPAQKRITKTTSRATRGGNRK